MSDLIERVRDISSIKAKADLSTLLKLNTNFSVNKVQSKLNKIILNFPVKNENILLEIDKDKFLEIYNTYITEKDERELEENILRKCKIKDLNSINIMVDLLNFLFIDGMCYILSFDTTKDEIYLFNTDQNIYSKFSLRAVLDRFKIIVLLKQDFNIKSFCEDLFKNICERNKFKATNLL